MNHFGEKIRQLREFKGMLQRELALELIIDAPMLSKIESGDRSAKREQVALLSKIFNVPEEDLLSLWLAEKVFDVVKNEEVALRAMLVVENELKSKRKGE